MALKWLARGTAAVLAVGLVACSASNGEDGAARGAKGPAPTHHSMGGGPQSSIRSPAKPIRICGNESVLGNGPVVAPEGAIAVPSGDNASVDFGQEGKTYWFAPGTHTLGDDEFSQIIPGDNSAYIGAPGAVLDGQKVNRYAFTQHAENVTIEYLTIQNFGPVGGNPNEGVVNHDQGDDWTIRYNTIRWNAGAGVMLGSGNVLEGNCLTRNGQYGFNAYSPHGPVAILMDRNEISFNNTYDWEAKTEGCGCTGGGKFWAVTDATVTNNYVHHNKGVGLWADNNNRGFRIEDNYIAHNDDEAVMYETSYNAVIKNNVIVGNAVAAGLGNPGFPTGAVYISESGGDQRVESRYRGSIDISGNLFRDNWGGVALWENADRYCGSPANTSTGECTLVNVGPVTAKSCNAENISREPYYDDCRWKTRNVSVHGNVFEYDPARVDPGCNRSASCGFNALMSNYGTYPDWSPYQGTVVQEAITFDQGNVFRDNTYRGPWHFVAFDQGRLVSFRQWQDRPYRQDQGSRMEASETSSG